MGSVEGQDDADAGRDSGDVSADERKDEDAQPTVPSRFLLRHLHSQIVNLHPQGVNLLLQILDRLHQRRKSAVDRRFHFGPSGGQLKLVSAGRRGGEMQSVDCHGTLSLSAVSIA